MINFFTLISYKIKHECPKCNGYSKLTKIFRRAICDHGDHVGVNKYAELKCQNCAHQWEQYLEWDGVGEGGDYAIMHDFEQDPVTL
ncbi:MAG: hypothetical protein Q8Q23_03885 [bacterium]|nr:hypothetical protein [bacterium]